MSTFNMNINMGPEEAVDSINGYFEKVAQWFVGDMEPEIKLPGQIWIDSYNKVIKQRNLENTGWIVRAPWSGAWGLPIGTKISQTLLPATTPGFILATGTTLIRADWPIFWAAVQAGNNIVTDEVWSAEKRYGSYSYGDGLGTFRIPMDFDFDRGWNPASGVLMGQWVEDSYKEHDHSMQYRSITVGSDGSNPFFVPSGPSSGTSYTSKTGGPETAPKHILYPKLIYTGEVW